MDLKGGRVSLNNMAEKFIIRLAQKLKGKLPFKEKTAFMKMWKHKTFVNLKTSCLITIGVLLKSQKKTKKTTFVTN